MRKRNAVGRFAIAFLAMLAFGIQMEAQKKKSPFAPYDPIKEALLTLDEKKSREKEQETEPINVPDEWWMFMYTDNEKYYFSPKRVTVTGKATVKLWIRHQLRANTETFKTLFLEEMKELGRTSREWQNYSHTLAYYECQCSTREQRSLSRTDYRQGGSVIESRDAPKAPWSPVVPDSVGEAILEIACKKIK